MQIERVDPEPAIEFSYRGSGNPEGEVEADEGAEYFDEDTGSVYVKMYAYAAGMIDNPKTGWVKKFPPLSLLKPGEARSAQGDIISAGTRIEWPSVKRKDERGRPLKKSQFVISRRTGEVVRIQKSEGKKTGGQVMQCVVKPDDGGQTVTVDATRCVIAGD